MRAACSCAHLKKRAGARAGAWGARKPSRGQGGFPCPQNRPGQAWHAPDAGQEAPASAGAFPAAVVPAPSPQGAWPCGRAGRWMEAFRTLLRDGCSCKESRRRAATTEPAPGPGRDGGPPAPAADRARDKKGRRPLRTTAPNLTGSAEAGNLVPSRSSFRLPGCVPAAR